MTEAPELVDLGEQSYGQRFHPTLDRLRAERPVCRGVLPDGSLVWLVTRYADVRAALSDPRLSLSKRHAKGWKGFGLPPVLDANLLNMDPPDHTRIRRLVSAVFRPRVVERLRPWIQQVTDDLLAEMKPLGRADLVGGFADPLCVKVICELLGIPEEDRNDLHTWNTTMLSEEPDAPRARDNIVRLMVALIRHKRANPAEDLISELVTARDEDGALSEEELTSLAFLIMVAGYTGPANFIGNAALALCLEPELSATLAEPAHTEAAVEELLRYDTSEAVAPRRFPVEDMEIGGVAIRAGEPVMLVLTAANRDEHRFTSAGRLVFDRTTNPHLSFGHGLHFCLGAGLARLESTIALGALVRALPGLRLAVSAAELPWLPNFRFRGLTGLPVTWNIH
jgi:cytochrome P450